MRTCILVALGLLLGARPAVGAEVDLAAFDASLGVRIERKGERLDVRWPAIDGKHARLTLNLDAAAPLIEELSLSSVAAGAPVSLVQGADPVLLLTVGQRDLSKKDGWVIFFDSPYQRPFETYRATLEKKEVRITSQARRVTIAIGPLAAGSFRGDLQMTVYPGTNLLQLDAVVSTEQEACAIVYDLGLASTKPTWSRITYIDNDDHLQQRRVDAKQPAQSLAVRNRAIAISVKAGALAIFPPPHRFLYPLDSADNFQLIWCGAGWRGMVPEWSIGVCQPREGDKRFVPWVNAPPGSKQHLNAFCVLTPGDAESYLVDVRRYTHDDRFERLPGYRTFTSHYHIEHTLDYLARQQREHTEGVPSSLARPAFVDVFKTHGVDIVHLAEFHVARPPEFYANRFRNLQVLHRECERLSNDEFLLLPGEEPNAHLGGHWISLFPKPVHWTFRRAANEPFVEQSQEYGKVYRVGNADEVLKLMETEHGLMWTAHPRIKSSLGFPDEYRERDFFASDRYLGAAWKAMPADLSLPRLGTRSLDLLDDMANWGHRKYVLGEVDVFRVEPQYEMYGHMNINYLRLDRLPRFADGWTSVLDVLRGGKFFVTTGEVLIPEFTVDGRPSGEVVSLKGRREIELVAKLKWTFPLEFAEVISGDGLHVARERIDLRDTGSFGEREIRLPLKLTGRKWVRLEVWDIATNGAFTQPVWLE